MTEIVHETAKVNLDELATKIHFECNEAAAIGHRRVEHAITAGMYLLQVKTQIGRGLKRWLAEHQLNRTDAYDFMMLAQNVESVRSSGHSSIAAALRMLRKAGKNGKASKTGSKSGSSKNTDLNMAWAKATVEERRRFIDRVGSNSLCEALSTLMRADLRRRVVGPRQATLSALDEIITKAIRQALSALKVAKAKDGPAPGVAAALNAINNKLESSGFDLNNVVIAVDPTMTQKQAA